MAITIRVLPQPGSIGSLRNAARRRQHLAAQQQIQFARLQNMRLQQQLQFQQQQQQQVMYGGMPLSYSTSQFGYGTGINSGYGYGYPAGQSPAQVCPPGYSPAYNNQFGGMQSALTGAYLRPAQANYVTQQSGFGGFGGFGFGW